MKRYFFEELYSYGILILSIFFYFIANVDHFFSWWVPDEINAINIGNNKSYYGCFTNYYIDTTINRITSDLVICTSSILYKLGTTPWLGLIFNKLIFSLTLPFSIAYLLRKTLLMTLTNSISVGFILTSIVSVVNYNPNSPLYSVDMAIYTTANSLLLILLAMNNENLLSKRFIIYCITFFLASCSHEVVLALCGIMLTERIYYLFKNKLYTKIILLISLYISASLSYFITPGYRQRLNTWPATENPIQAFNFIMDTLPLIGNQIINYSFIFLFAIIFGLFFSIINRKNNKINLFQIHRLLFYAVGYLVVICFLVGFTSSLKVTPNGGIPPRMSFEIFLLLSFVIFSSSYALGSYLKNKYLFYNHNLKIGINSLTILILLFLSLIHPDLYVFKYSVENVVKSVIAPNILSEEVFPGKNILLPSLSRSIYSREITPNYIFILRYFNIDRLLANTSTKKLRIRELSDKLNAININDYYGINSPWLKILFDIYKQSYFSYFDLNVPCTWFFPNKSSICYRSSTDLNLNKYKIINKNLLELNQTSNIIITPTNNGYQLSDTGVTGEHYAYTNFDIKKGIYFISVNGDLDNRMKSYIYLTSKNNQILIPWINRNSDEKSYNYFGSTNDLQILFTQIGTNKDGVDFINIIFSSQRNLNITLRYQHGVKSSTIYKGIVNNTSKIGEFYFGEVVQK